MAVRPFGDGRWLVEFEQAGERVFRRCPPSVGKAEALQFEAALRRALFRRQALGEREIVPLAAAVELWLKETEPHKRDKKKPRQNAILLAELIGNHALEEAPDVAQAAVQAWATALSAKTINRRLAVLKATCKHAWRRGLIDVNLSGRIPLLPEGPGREVYLSKAEIRSLARAAPDVQTEATIMILAYSGLRWSEYAALPRMSRRASDFHIPDSKTRKARMVPIVDTIRPYLSVLPIGMPYRTFIEGFWRARVAAGMTHVRLHDLRHTCASLLANRGADLQTVAELLGDHLLTARRYAHLVRGRLRQAMRRIG